MDQYYPAFNPTNAFVVTYDYIGEYSACTMYAAVQIIIVTDSIISYVILDYKECLNNGYLSSTPGLNFMVNGIGTTWAASNPCLSSNVGITGLWIFQAQGFVKIISL